MSYIKRISLTGYRVTMIDLREPKPREPREVIHPADHEWLEALAMIGLSVPDAIRSRYERAGYRVISVDRIPQKRTATIDLLQLWEAAEPPATAPESEASQE